MDERLESSWCTVYYLVSGEPGIARCSTRSDNYLGECGSSFTNYRRVILFFACLIFAVSLNHEIIFTAKFPDLRYMCNFHVHFSELFDVTRHCGTEQHHLFLLWTVLQEGLDLLLE